VSFFDIDHDAAACAIEIQKNDAVKPFRAGPPGMAIHRSRLGRFDLDSRRHRDDEQLGAVPENGPDTEQQ